MKKLFTVESPDVRHIDEGRAKLKKGIVTIVPDLYLHLKMKVNDVNKGFANVSIDPIFKETIEGDYNVYVAPEGKTKALYVAEKASVITNSIIEGEEYHQYSGKLLLKIKKNNIPVVLPEIVMPEAATKDYYINPSIHHKPFFSPHILN